MPALARGRAAWARADLQLAERAAAQGLGLSIGQIASWRRARIIESPQARAEPGRRRCPGPKPRIYSDSQLVRVDAVLAECSRRTRRGRPGSDLAIFVYAAGLPVDHEVVLTAMRSLLGRLAASFDSASAQARNQFPAPVEWAESEVFEQAHALAQKAIADPGPMTTNVACALRAMQEATTLVDVRETMTGLFAILLGGALDTAELDVRVLLHMFGGQGLIEQTQPALPTGVGDLKALTHHLKQTPPIAATHFPDDVTLQELREAYRQCSALACVAGSDRDAIWRDRLGGPMLGLFWDADDAAMIAVVVSWFIQARRIWDPFDLTSLLADPEQNGDEGANT